ncbi:TraX family protein [Chromobacterium piscinae]|uniref:TraX family protein n=1 Tax=Chromobacterium piscinae TaxID=686831 RepID=UPI001E47EC72|nr:TraX family protein [Chromobacterium piscinae]MCD5327843.1 conjugal transfer protein TraX [Chromobacterium piscinae]
MRNKFRALWVRGAAISAPAFTPGQLDHLKLLAFISMLADHVNKGLLHGAYPWMTSFGRLAFPLFAVVFAFNLVHHFSQPRRFVMLSLAFGLLAQWPFHYVIAIHGKNQQCLNILFTFLIAWGVNRLWGRGNGGVVAASLLFTFGGVALSPASYSWHGLGFILALVGWFRYGGVAFPLLAMAVLGLVVYGFPWMYLTILFTIWIVAGPWKVEARRVRFLPRLALYIGYALHLWVIYGLSLQMVARG